MLEGLLATYGDALPAAVKTAAQKEVIALRDRVGTIALVKAEPGAAVVIDGRARGEHPSAAPLRVVAGTHVVRIYKEGFEPFETAASVAGGQTTSVVARLAPLVASGRLRVAERSGRALAVMVDGFEVGKTPWEGPIAVGEHTVVLRGEDSLKWVLVGGVDM
ncbi:PEGA domain-containing protein [Sorangium sp. So ce296]|uniref:PEGA domain-containing protein n=1 Tax=Sorangium sp. So ce296 TaxID=3133296 RepID=UPI003F5DAB6D